MRNARTLPMFLHTHCPMGCPGARSRLAPPTRFGKVTFLHLPKAFGWLRNNTSSLFWRNPEVLFHGPPESSGGIWRAQDTTWPAAQGHSPPPGADAGLSRLTADRWQSSECRGGKTPRFPPPPLVWPHFTPTPPRPGCAINKTPPNEPHRLTRPVLPRLLFKR